MKTDTRHFLVIPDGILTLQYIFDPHMAHVWPENWTREVISALINNISLKFYTRYFLEMPDGMVSHILFFNCHLVHTRPLPNPISGLGRLISVPRPHIILRCHYLVTYVTIWYIHFLTNKQSLHGPRLSRLKRLLAPHLSSL